MNMKRLLLISLIMTVILSSSVVFAMQTIEKDDHKFENGVLTVRGQSFNLPEGYEEDEGKNYYYDEESIIHFKNSENKEIEITVYDGGNQFIPAILGEEKQATIGGHTGLLSEYEGKYTFRYDINKGMVIITAPSQENIETIL